jgi:hypothetical protein
MATTIQEIEAGVLGAIKAAAVADQANIVAWLGQNELLVKNGLVNLFKNIPSVGGLAGMFAGPIQAAVEAGIESYVTAFMAKESPQTIFNLFIGALTTWQSEV